MTLSPQDSASHGHSRAHFMHLLHMSCRPKSIILSTASGMSVVMIADLKRGPTKGLRTSSPMRLISPSPASSSSGTWITSLSMLVCERAE